MKIFKLQGALTAAAFSFLVFAAPTQAAYVTGVLGFSGNGVLAFSNGGGAQGTNYIDWCPVAAGTVSDGCGTANNGVGTMQVDSRSGSFVSLIPTDSTGTIKDITDNSVSPGMFTYLPIGVPVDISSFLTFAAAPTYNFHATLLQAQVCAPSADQLCAGAFRLNDIGDSVIISMSILGYIDNVGDKSPYTLAVSAQFAAADIPTIISQATSTSGAFSNSWSAELKATAIPEPGSIALLGGGLLALGMINRRRRSS